MKAEDLSFFGSDPGAVKHGNFINYYNFHSTKERIDNLHPAMFSSTLDEPILCLDIGCNTGQLSHELHSYLKIIYPNFNIHVLAVDIDPILIQRAKEAYNNSNVNYATVNVMTETDREVMKRYLVSYKRQRFDITFCFSVTMWIHLNNGDDGLTEFLRYIQEISRTIIIEPQPWNCYRNAQRRVKKSGSSFLLYETLKIRSNVDSFIESVLSENKHKKVFESSTSSWKRKVQSYQQVGMIVKYI